MNRNLIEEQLTVNAASVAGCDPVRLEACRHSAVVVPKPSIHGVQYLVRLDLIFVVPKNIW
jgi:hypothetical protein